MSFDLKRTFADKTLTRELAAGTIVEQEGLLLCAVLEDGKEKASLLGSVDGSEKVLGFAKTADSQPDRTSAVEDVTVPSASLEADLSNTNLVTSRIRVEVEGVALTVSEVTSFSANVADNTVEVILASGRAKFHSDEAGKVATFTYLHDLTLAQSKQIYGERFINNRGLHEEHGYCEVGTGLVELYTDQFDASADWAGSGDIKIGVNGQLVKSGSGKVLNLTVVNVPNIDNPLLGVRGYLGEK